MQLGLGTAWFGKIPLLKHRKQTRELFAICRDSGIDYVDTAHSYFQGLAEGLVGKGIQATVGWAPNVATKVGLGILRNSAQLRSNITHGTGSESLAYANLQRILEKELKKSIRRLAPILPSTVLLHCPPGNLTENPKLWSQFTEMVASCRILSVGLSVDRFLSDRDLPEEYEVPVIQVTAKQFVEQNHFFQESTKTRSAIVVVHRIVDLAENFNAGLALLSEQPRRPNVALVGTTRPERLRQIIKHWETLDSGSKGV